MKVSDENNRYIITPAVTSITGTVLSEIVNLLSGLNSQKQVVFDLTGVESCINSFFVLLKKLSCEAVIVNPESTLLALLYMSGFDRCVKIYGDMLSMNENRRELINRRFTII
ncbi:MAG: hypothetical protein LUB59_01735 [Candidatus Gastranaerophilales bacterium]|nr:hypothetical protein [Candidatus Gastranaerophilales bacterium]